MAARTFDLKKRVSQCGNSLKCRSNEDLSTAMTSVGMMEATSAGHKRGRLFVYDLFYKTFKGVTKALIA